MSFYRIPAIAFLLVANGFLTSCQDRPSAWKRAEEIVRSIPEPAIPAKEFRITDFGAKGDGTTDCTEAFRKAIAECSKSGGGKIVVPRGEFLTGPIHLKSRTNLFVADSAVIKFSRDPKDYLPLVLTRWEGVECMNYSPFIYAFGEEDIAITGKGTLDGQADKSWWWPWKGKAENGWKDGMPNQDPARARLFELAERGVPVAERLLGEGSFMRPCFIQPYRCKNVLIEGVKIINSPMWEINPVLDENVIVRDVNINSHGPNNDGIDPECSKNVLIERCSFNTGDDCIAIKSGRNNDGRRINVASENIVIRNCNFLDGHGGVTIGSEISGGAREIYVEDCRFDSPILYSALRLKSNAVRGGTIERLFLRRLTVGQVERAAFDVDLQYEEGEKGNYLPTIRDITIDSMVVDQCGKAVNLVGYEKAPLSRILMTNCHFGKAKKEPSIKYVDQLELIDCTVNGRPFTVR